jgi:hypothetical protein
MEHELYKSIDITHPVTGEHNNTLILAHVKYIHTRKDVVTESFGSRSAWLRAVVEKIFSWR